MKHTIELKMPKFFGRKTEMDPEGETEVRMKNKDITTVVAIAVPLIVGLTAGYFVGFNKGVMKNSNMYIIK
jgi:hypothetical protein